MTSPHSALLLVALSAAAAAAAADPKRKNVLMIIVDDLRPEVSAFNQSLMHTPNIDRLGKQGVVFARTYCQQAICGPTRNSFLSGRRPQRTESWNFLDSFREVGPDWISFPEVRKEKKRGREGGEGGREGRREGERESNEQQRAATCS
jgi:iduronate 2-sulfatase